MELWNSGIPILNSFCWLFVCFLFTIRWISVRFCYEYCMRHIITQYCLFLALTIEKSFTIHTYYLCCLADTISIDNGFLFCYDKLIKLQYLLFDHNYSIRIVVVRDNIYWTWMWRGSANSPPICYSLHMYPGNMDVYGL